MKAVVLVGGEGTRLRPLTETIPKPLIPLVDRPFLHHVLDHLARYGVHEVVLSSPYLEERFASFLEDRHGDPRITWITEATPLGTGGAVANAAVAAGLDETFLVLNGDILTDLDLGAMVSFHHGRGAAATIALTPVPDARPYGLVELDGDRVTAFREKPAEAVPGVVNAGTYVLEPSAIGATPSGAMVSIERETFPDLIESGAPVHGFVADAYWMDLGTPEKYLQATFDALRGAVRGLDYECPYVDRRALVSLRAHVGRWVVVASGATIGHDAVVDDSVVLDGAVIEEGARVRDSVIGPGAVVGARATVADVVLGQGARVDPDVQVVAVRISAAGEPLP